MVETREQLIRLLESARDSILEAAKVAEQDEKRPEYHFRALAQWMDDPNGIIYHNGYYHMMYSWNPNSDSQRAGMAYKTAHRIWDPDHEDWTGGITVWGHARSKDLLHWEHLPIALYPIIDKGEHFIWFGTTAINDKGIPIAVYTSVGPKKRPEDTADQWLWFGDADMMCWEPAKENPILDYSLHGGEVLTEWRDPFVVKNEGKAYLILGARRLKDDGADAVVVLYEAENADYTAWSYKGVIFSLGDRDVPSCECPNLIKIHNNWVLLLSLHGKAEYYVGDMDFENARFENRTNGMIDHSANFYATNVMMDKNSRQILYGAVEGFQGTKGWNGCVSLPREITLKDDRLIQNPAAELERLRGARGGFAGKLASGTAQMAGKIQAGTAEILLHVKSKGRVKLNFLGEQMVSVVLDDKSVTIAGQEVAVEWPEEKNARIFIDRTVIEMFLGNGECVTTVLPDPIINADIEILAKETCLDVDITIFDLQCDDLFSSELFE